MKRAPLRTESEIVASATTAIEHILEMPILETHKRELISDMIWKITEARGKYATRYRSRKALELAGELQHEHVFPRKDIIDRLLASPSCARDILNSAVACVVTVEEHQQLSLLTRRNRSLRGWDRYRAAGIEIVDTDTSSIMS